MPIKRKKEVGNKVRNVEEQLLGWLLKPVLQIVFTTESSTKNIAKFLYNLVQLGSDLQRACACYSFGLTP